MPMSLSKSILLLLPIMCMEGIGGTSSHAAYKRDTHRLSKPLIGNDGRIYACTEDNLFSFNANGSIAWSVHLNYKCNINTAPVHGGSGEIYLAAGDRVLKISFQHNGTSDPGPQVFFGPSPGQEGPYEVVGLAVSTSSSMVYITVKRRGLFAYTTLGEYLWIAGPVFELFGYRLGCQKDIRDCFFTTPPVIDLCEASIYIANSAGEIYSISLRSPTFRWVQDISSLDKDFCITPGNNGQLYVIFPVKSLVVALDASSGAIQWQKIVGPLSVTASSPAVDSNGWVSISSLDGALYSLSPSGALRKFPRATTPGYVIQVDPVLDCSGYAVYVSRTRMDGKVEYGIGEDTYVLAKKPESSVFSLLVPATGTVHWSKSDPDEVSVLSSEKDLKHFVLDESIVLAFIAASNTGNPRRCRSAPEKLASSCSLAGPSHVGAYVGSKSADELFLLFETMFLIVLALLVRFCCIFWRKQKLQGRGLTHFLEKRRWLQLKKKEYDRTITGLQRQAADEAADEAATSKVIEEIGDLVRARETVERKLSTSYSLGRDATSSRSKSIVPSYTTKARSLSLRNTEKESTKVFGAPSDGGSDSDRGEQKLSVVEGESSMGGGSTTEDDGWYEDEAEETAKENRKSPSEPGPSSMWSAIPPPAARDKRLQRRRTMSFTY